ncbi:O-antigen ligase family protein [Bacteroidales bacterium OttesenSCG-928-L19]|nr:O-antigen ligase family protein [Bacteroidales bacterium OttesenSCG-928-L19]
MERYQKIILYTSAIAFIFVNCVAIRREIFLVPLLSAFLVGLYLLVYHFDWSLYLMAFITPLSVTLREISRFNMDISLPSEAIMILITLLFLFRTLYGYPINRKLLTHPVSIAIYVYLFWLLITSITSELPLVSFKFFASKLWFIIACYFAIQQLFQKNRQHIVRFFTAYALGLGFVVIITTLKHASMGFSEVTGHWIMSPFYNDHTAYGAILAFFLPIVIAFIFLPENKKWVKTLYITLTVIFGIAFFLSYSRAAWISFLAAILVWIILKMRIKLSWVVIGLVVLGAAFFTFSDEILYRMSRNTQASSGNLKEQLQSITNITTDDSNVERINRWVAAGGLIEERPVFGWGPGTYQFVYAPFQRGKYKTAISTNFGDGGNAHSEYIGPFAEGGVLGLLTVFTLVVMILYYGVVTYIRSSDKTVRLITLALTFALVTYAVHGVLNNFLDTDKLALPYWAAFAAIVVLNQNVKEEATN